MRRSAGGPGPARREARPRSPPGTARREARPRSPPDIKEKSSSCSSSTTSEDPEPIPYVLRDDIQALAIKEEDLERRADFIEVSCQDVTVGALKEKQKGKMKEKVHQTPLPEHKALQNWNRHMTIRKKQEKHLGEILQRPEDELLMSGSEDYRKIQEERDLIDRSLPALLPGKGYRRGSEFWSQPERISDELTGLMITLTQQERGYPEPVTHVGKPRTVQMETGLKPPKKIPFHQTWDKSLFLKQRWQELKPILEELDFHKPDLDALEVIGKGQPFTSVSTELPPLSIISEESETTSDSLQDDPDVVPEAVRGPSLNLGGKPARWINYSVPCRDKIGITAGVPFETKAGQVAENSLTVINDGTTVIWYDWMRLPGGIPSKEPKGLRMPRFYFDTRSGVIFPGQTKKFSVIFKSERSGVFSENWEFRTHPVLLGGALLKVTLCGLAEHVDDEWAEAREKLKVIKHVTGRDRPAPEDNCRCLPVFAGPVAPLENVTLSPACALVESGVRSRVLEDFAASLPLSRRRFRARRAAAGPSAPGALPVGSTGRAHGCIAKGNRYREASGEKLRPPASVAVPGSSLTHGDVAGGAVGHPAAGAGGAGPVARVVRERGGRRAWLLGTSARPWPGSGGRERCPEPGEGWTRRSGCGSGGIGTEVGGGTDTGNHCPQALLCGADTPLPARVISDGERIVTSGRSRIIEFSGKSEWLPVPVLVRLWL
ncbi:MYCBP-associated protein [Aegotheles albertisi]